MTTEQHSDPSTDAAAFDGAPSTLFGSTEFGVAADPTARHGGGAASAFDVCHVGVVLRTVLLVHAVVGLGALFVASGWAGWLLAFASGVAVALPATLLWLVLVCSGKKVLTALPQTGQWVALVAAGALCGALGWAQWTWLAQDSGLSWTAPVMSGGALAAAVHYWLRARAGKQRPADATARLAELQSRIRPHFLFNTLNTAIALVRVDPSRAETVLEDLAELFRVALAEPGAAVMLSEEVALAQRYLDIEQVRFGDRLKVTWELDPLAGEARVPPLLLQPLVENAVRHGVEPAADGGSIKVRTRVKRGHVAISVVNTVTDAPASPGNGIALKNVRERLRLMHDVAAQFETRLEDGWFRVQIVVPLPAR